MLFIRFEKTSLKAGLWNVMSKFFCHKAMIDKGCDD